MTGGENMLTRLVQFWQSAGVARSGVLPDALKRFEERYNVTLPDDAQRYLKAVDGMEEGSGDAELFRFLPLSEVQPVSALFEAPGSPADHYFVFVDYCIGSHFYAINLDRGQTHGSVARVYGPDQIHPAWASIDDFLAAYLHDASDLL